MSGVGRDDGPADDQAGRVAELFLADDLAQFFDDSGEHAARLTSQPLLAEERGHRAREKCRSAAPCTGSQRPLSSLAMR